MVAEGSTQQLDDLDQQFRGHPFALLSCDDDVRGQLLVHCRHDRCPNNSLVGHDNLWQSGLNCRIIADKSHHRQAHPGVSSGEAGGRLSRHLSLPTMPTYISFFVSEKDRQRRFVHVDQQRGLVGGSALTQMPHPPPRCRCLADAHNYCSTMRRASRTSSRVSTSAWTLCGPVPDTFLVPKWGPFSVHGNVPNPFFLLDGPFLGGRFLAPFLATVQPRPLR